MYDFRNFPQNGRSDEIIKIGEFYELIPLGLKIKILKFLGIQPRYRRI